MELHVRLDANGCPELLGASRSWVRGLEVHIPCLEGGTLQCAGWEAGAARDRWGSHRLFTASYTLWEEPLLRFALHDYGDAVRAEVVLLRSLTGLGGTDAFSSPSIFGPAFRIPKDVRFLLSTFGLDGAEGFPGGYWPAALVGRDPAELPGEAFAPLVLFAEGGAVAIAPADHFLTSALVRLPGGAGRGLHGAVDRLPAGFTLTTWFVAGDDPMEALARLGDKLLAQGGKERGAFPDHPLLSALGYWNAYGSYYTEPLNPMDGELLVKLAASFREAGIPVRYFGLDLWYPYEVIGRARAFRPDPRKYPQGLKALRERTGSPYVLHLSALSSENEYGESGAEPEVYRLVAEEAEAQGAIAIWHDWLRTWQHLTTELRRDPGAAERWFSGMARAFGERGLPVVLCMQTMGMVLASTQQPNVIAARSHTDHLFAQRQALERAARLGHPDFLRGWIPPHRLWKQNLLMGAILWALGLAPFHDLFLSRLHPGFGGHYPLEDALLRALSCGPVGFGDKLGMADSALLRRLVLPDGTLAQPDRPPLPLLSTLGAEVQAFWTERAAGNARWLYLLILNTGEEAVEYTLEPPIPGDWAVWDPLSNRFPKEEKVSIPAHGLRYLVFAPRRDGVAPLGFLGLLVPAPRKAMASAFWDGGWELRVGSNPGALAIASAQALSVTGADGLKVSLSRHGEHWLCHVEGEGRILVRRR